MQFNQIFNEIYLCKVVPLSSSSIADLNHLGVLKDYGLSVKGRNSMLRFYDRQEKQGMWKLSIYIYII